MVNRVRLAWWVLVLGAALFVACIAPIEVDEDLGPELDRSSIVGGAEEYGFPLIGTLAGYDGSGVLYPFCTATPVSKTVLITAAHCIDAFLEFGNNVAYARLSPDGSGETHLVNSGTIRRHPSWDPNPWGGGYINDIGVVELQAGEFIDADMFPEQHRNPETVGDRGTPLKVVGFGVSNPPIEGSGTKRSIDMSVTEVMGQYFTMVIDGWRGVCYGDSGGPSFVLGEHRDSQWGVHARTQIDSCGPAEDTSVGYFYNDFVRSNVLALDPDAETCGDGVCTGLEIEAECPADCAPYECGDNVSEGPEVCDDGNTAGGDGCSADCLSDETCGNSVTDAIAGEVCDDGNTTGGDGCSADCLSDETCGNSVTDAIAGEACDDGNLTGGDGCSADCSSDESCGNDLHDDLAGEACDDGNTVAGDGCSADCRSTEICGNAIIDNAVGEACDDGNTDSGDGCSGDCLVAEGCGNGTLESSFGEICDDGNERDGDGCSANCRSNETCGNGVLDAPVGETCDDENVIDGDECPADCGVPVTEGLNGMSGGCWCQSALFSPTPRRGLSALLSLLTRW